MRAAATGIQADVETASTDMTSDDDSSVQSSDSSGAEHFAAAAAAPLIPNGNSFHDAFVAFNIHQH